jgi:hypothetical protein
MKAYPTERVLSPTQRRPWASRYQFRGLGRVWRCQDANAEILKFTRRHLNWYRCALIFNCLRKRMLMSDKDCEMALRLLSQFLWAVCLPW